MKERVGERAPARATWFLALALVASAAVACESAGAAGGADAGGGPTDTGGGGAVVPRDVQEQRRDLSRWFVDGEAVETIDPMPEWHIPEGALPEQIAALERVNWYRWEVGLLPIDLDLQLSQAAQYHCDCYVAHHAEYSGGMSAHNEDPSWPDPCMGAAPWDRTDAAGVSGWGISEVIAFTGTPTSAVDGWMGTLYHRLPIVDPTTQSCGYGERTNGNPRINTMNCAHGNTVPDINAILLYPPDGAEDVPVSWDGYEDPQPPEPPTGYPSGPIITMTVGQAFIVVTEALVDERGAPVPHTFLDSTNDEHLDGANTISLYAHDPLEDGVTYTVRLQIDLSDRPQDIEWSFTTLDNPFSD